MMLYSTSAQGAIPAVTQVMPPAYPYTLTSAMRQQLPVAGGSNPLQQMMMMPSFPAPQMGQAVLSGGGFQPQAMMQTQPMMQVCLLPPTLPPMMVPAAATALAPEQVIAATIAPDPDIPVAERAPEVAIPVAERAEPEARAAATQPVRQEPPRAQQDARRVVAVTGLRINDDLAMLAAVAARNEGAEVVNYLGVWNKNTLLVELDRNATTTRRTCISAPGVHPGIFLGPSPIDRVERPTAWRTLNARVFVMDPKYDYVGSPAEIELYERTKREWLVADSGESINEMRAIVEAAGGKHWIIVPRQPRIISSLERQRCYTQLHFKYSDIKAATHALNQIEGLEDTTGGLRVTIRAEYSKYSKPINAAGATGERKTRSALRFSPGTPPHPPCERI
eukprot:Hpha_TRINITY_DN16370_c5_g1::TRINITY_DN16370_c5_g1_i3::g.62466::m.62466